MHVGKNTHCNMYISPEEHRKLRAQKKTRQGQPKQDIDLGSESDDIEVLALLGGSTTVSSRGHNAQQRDEADSGNEFVIIGNEKTKYRRQSE